MDLNGENIFWGGLMYTSYFALFTHFAIKRYYKKLNCWRSCCDTG